ncbi:hypothetical protein ACQEVZ_60010 [Dactylosporangium sp. CA-152071]|uniref:hypothetical protein n=1 Tax=Dactylosporangium sp. CA-152071 TaxID=3239933 RepID=UPI003D8D9E7D
MGAALSTAVLAALTLMTGTTAAAGPLPGLPSAPADGLLPSPSLLPSLPALPPLPMPSLNPPAPVPRTSNPPPATHPRTTPPNGLPGLTGSPAAPTTQPPAGAPASAVESDAVDTAAATVTAADGITVHIRLKGGQHHTLTLPLPLAAWQLRQTPPHVVVAIDELLDDHTDSQIAAILTGRNLTSGTGQPLYGRLIGQIRHHHQLRSHTQRLRDAGLLTLTEIGHRLGVSPNTVKTWRNRGLLTGRLANDKGEYLYQLPDTDLPRPRPGRPPRNPSTTKTTTASTTRSAV